MVHQYTKKIVNRYTAIMKKTIKFALALGVAGITNYATAQQLSVQSIEASVNGQAELVFAATNATSMTALQFNLSLPEGVILANNNATQGTATNGHTLDVETLDNGDYLFILYSMDLNTFKDGELLRIPVAIGSNAKSGEGCLYTVRFSTTEAVSSDCSNSSFTLKIQDIDDAIELMKVEHNDVETIEIFNLGGQRLNEKHRGVNVLKMKDGTTKKTMIK